MRQDAEAEAPEAEAGAEVAWAEEEAAEIEEGADVSCQRASCRT